MKIVAGNYKAQNDSLLKQCEQYSLHDGALHSSVIHFVQSKTDCLKAAISSILDACPSVYPLDFKDQFAKDGFEPTREQTEHFKTLNCHLLMPVSGDEVAEIIEQAKQYVQDAQEKRATECQHHTQP